MGTGGECAQLLLRSRRSSSSATSLIHPSAQKGNSAKFAMAVVLCGVDTYSVAYDMFSCPPLGGRQEYKKQ
jgi:hypothetical protein